MTFESLGIFFFLVLSKSSAIGHDCPSLFNDFYMRPDAGDKYCHDVDQIIHCDQLKAYWSWCNNKFLSSIYPFSISASPVTGMQESGEGWSNHPTVQLSHHPTVWLSNCRWLSHHSARRSHLCAERTWQHQQWSRPEQAQQVNGTQNGLGIDPTTSLLWDYSANDCLISMFFFFHHGLNERKLLSASSSSDRPLLCVFPRLHSIWLQSSHCTTKCEIFSLVNTTGLV